MVLSEQVSAVTTRQQETGLWGANYLAYTPSEKEGTLEVGTVAQYRRCCSFGVPTTTRPFRLADRLLFRTLSRDDDPLLYGEFADPSEDEPATAETYRNLIRDGVCAALAEAGREDDPRLRGAAHKVDVGGVGLPPLAAVGGSVHQARRRLAVAPRGHAAELVVAGDDLVDALAAA